MSAKELHEKMQADLELMEALLSSSQMRADVDNWDTLEMSLRSSADACALLADKRADMECPGWTAA